MNTPAAAQGTQTTVDSKDAPLSREILDRARDRALHFREQVLAIEKEVRKVIVGMDKELRLVVASIFTGGHVLMEGTPGLAKTRLVKAVAKTVGLDFQRIQFTPDLLPSDITGSLVQTASRQFEFQPGPIFSNIILADEINRAGPKTQSALLEAMEEKQVTQARNTYPLPTPFIVLATQNPLESSGTYPLPDAQLDRFSIKVKVPNPSEAELDQILQLTTDTAQHEVSPLFTKEEAPTIIASQRELVLGVAVSDEVRQALVRVTVALRPENSKLELVSQNIWAAPSPRGAIYALLLAKTLALLDGRAQVMLEDIEHALVPSLSHRIILRPECQDGKVTPESILQEVAKKALR